MFRFIAIALLLLSVAKNVYAAPETDWKQGKWGNLSQYIGTYKYQEIYNDPAVAAKLAKLPVSELEHLKKNLNVMSPIGFSADCLVLEGNAPHQGGEEMARMNVCLHKGEIHIALFSKDEIKIYSETKDYEYLPRDLLLWTEHVANTKGTWPSREKPSLVKLITLSESVKND